MVKRLEIQPFQLERWFAKYEHEADIMLAESGIRSLKAEKFDLDPGKLGYVIPTNGDPALRQQIAGEKYNRSKDEILFTCGTQEANFLTFLSLLSRGDHVITITPTYQALSSIPEAFANVTRIWLEPPTWELNIQKVAEAIRAETKLIVLNNPNNPTGRYHSREVVNALYDLAEDHDAYLLCDEVYRLLSDDPLDPVATIGEHGISSTSLTKSFGLAGARFGWVVASKDVIRKAWRWKDYTTISPSVFGQYIAKQVFNGREAEILRENRQLAKNNRERVLTFLDEYDLDWHYPVGVNGFVTIPEAFPNSVDFCKRLFEEKKVVLAPGEVFGYDQYFRIGFGLPSKELEEGLTLLSGFLR